HLLEYPLLRAGLLVLVFHDLFSIIRVIQIRSSAGFGPSCWQLLLRQIQKKNTTSTDGLRGCRRAKTASSETLPLNQISKG
ncbi:AAEL012678-PA, partial [Aedes aegypti]